MARLFPLEDFYESLKALGEEYQIQTAVFLSGIGQLNEIELGFFKQKGDYAPQIMEGPHELLSLSGTVLKQNDNWEFHVHAVLGDEQKKVWGGHLIKAKVTVTCELVLLKTDPLFSRSLEEETGLKGMFFN